MSTFLSRIVASLFPKRWKEYHELEYWKQRKSAESTLGNAHYEQFYTSHFGLDHSDYSEKRVLDIGCGPRGSLEWADMAKRRVGLDPLASKYLKLGADRHNMEYVAQPSESMPFENSSFDIVCSFNSLDHVSDIDRAISEIKRVLSPGGFFLLLVEANQQPTPCEPHLIDPSQLISRFEPELRCETFEVYKPVASGCYDSILAGEKFNDAMKVTELGWISARFERI